jgi:hypothetical protein
MPLPSIFIELFISTTTALVVFLVTSILSNRSSGGLLMFQMTFGLWFPRIWDAIWRIAYCLQTRQIPAEVRRRFAGTGASSIYRADFAIKRRDELMKRTRAMTTWGSRSAAETLKPRSPTLDEMVQRYGRVSTQCSAQVPSRKPVS